jgi:hypothetical protein
MTGALTCSTTCAMPSMRCCCSGRDMSAILLLSQSAAPARERLRCMACVRSALTLLLCVVCAPLCVGACTRAHAYAELLSCARLTSRARVVADCGIDPRRGGQAGGDGQGDPAEVGARHQARLRPRRVKGAARGLAGCVRRRRRHAHARARAAPHNVIMNGRGRRHAGADMQADVRAAP